MKMEALILERRGTFITHEASILLNRGKIHPLRTSSLGPSGDSIECGTIKDSTVSRYMHSTTNHG
jgi:hypothetical protein